ncbi:unnamed protein product [Parajaminaea phylloscopi]
MPCKDCSCSEAQQGPSVTLPGAKTASASESTPLWATTSSKGAIAGSSSNATTGNAASQYGSIAARSGRGHPLANDEVSTPPPPPPQCDGDVTLRGGVCCRQLKDSDTRTLIDPDVVRDVIIGLSDGLTVPFALTAGLSGVGSSRLVVIAGLAELVSGAISMGVGGFLSAQAELQHYNFMAQRTHERVLRSCSSAVVDEVCEILTPYGVPQDVAAMVANKLAGVEGNGHVPNGSGAAAYKANDDEEAAMVTSAREEDQDQGLTPFILRVGEGLEPISASRAWQSAVTIGLSYFLGGLLPLFPYIFFKTVSEALFCSVAVTAVTLLVFGVVKQRCTGGAAGWKGYAYGAFSTLTVGGLAAGASWAIVRALEGGESP